MYKITVFIHGSLAESLARTLRLILSNQSDTETYCVEPGCGLEEMRNGVEQSIRRLNDPGQEILVLTDLMYGTPFNTTIQLEGECSFTRITGTSLPLLIEAINRRLPDGDSRSFARLVDTAKEGIVDGHVPLRVS